MKNVIGFSVGDDTRSESAVITAEPVQETPVRSLVKVFFPEMNKSYTYYNDRFDMKEGDRVYVSGRLAGVIGTVESVNTRFRICLDDYQKVLSRFSIDFRGSYERMLDKMVSFSIEAPSADEARSWFIPPAEDEEKIPEIVSGDGYSFNLADFETEVEVEPGVPDRALEYCNRGNVLYLSLSGETGTAFVRGTQNYEINFRYCSGSISELYCNCPYPGFCKHNVAVMITLRVLLNEMGETKDFTAIDSRFFWLECSRSAKKVFF